MGDVRYGLDRARLQAVAVTMAATVVLVRSLREGLYLIDECIIHFGVGQDLVIHGGKIKEKILIL